jgi:alpha-D-xyloside xylohydrolase
VIGLEPGWHSKSYPCTYEWHPERFHDPASFVATMKAAGFHINLWENPYVSPDARIYPALKPLSGSHSVWAGLAPDYSLSEVQATYTAQHKQDHLAIGVSGYKLDECDGSELTRNSWMFPAHAQFPSGYDGEQMRQMYGLLLQKITTDMYRESGQRTYGLVRASTAGASSFPYVLYTDLYDHREFVRALCNSSFSGLLWTPEVRNAKNEVDWVRRIQTVCFSPIAMLDAWSSGTKPWSYPHVEHIVKKYMNLRMQLLPYFYSAFARYHYEGIPPFRALHLDFPEIASAFRASYDQDVSVHAYGKKSVVELDDQFMAGDSLLVAPLFEGQSSRRVYLPRGFWYDFETGERYEGGQFITVQPGLEKIPLFVKDGGIIPMMPVMQHVPKQGQSVPLEIRHYGTKQGVFKLYDDDGVSLAYESGDYQWMSLEVRAEQDGLVGAVKKPTHTNHASYGELSWKINYRA